MIGLALVAKPLVLVLLTEKWAPCIPYLHLLCVVGLMHPLHLINLNMLKAKGRADLFLRLEIVKKLLIVIAIIITYRWGITALICGQIATSFLSYYLNVYYIGKLLDYPLKEQIFDLAPYLGIAMIMGVGVYSVQWFSFSNNGTLLTFQVLSGIVIYIALCGCLRLGAFMEVRQLLLLQTRSLFRKGNMKYDIPCKGRG